MKMASVLWKGNWYLEVKKAANNTFSYEVLFETKDGSGNSDVGCVINILRKKNGNVHYDLAGFL